VPDSAVWTIGHSTRSLAEFIELLRAHHIERLVDVRTVPRSRRHPHFESAALAVSMRDAGIDYHHLPGLGGLRKPSRESSNLVLRHAIFRGYADYMASEAFDDALRDLERLADVRTAIMCAEAVWWQCHRQLIADALVARGREIFHIMSARRAELHRLTGFARVTDGRVSYPGLLG
jgi:uncharacterized protein (DUF488 family)